MNRFARLATLTALSVLIFANLTAAQDDSIYRLKAGTRITVKLETELSSRFSSVDDTFLARVAEPLAVRDSIVVPAGTVVEGRVTRVSRARAGSSGRLDVVFEALQFPGSTRRIEGVLVEEVEADTSAVSGLLTALGGAAVGALLGAIDSGRGALIGAGIGAGAGAGIALSRKGKDAVLSDDTEFEIKLKKEVVVPVPDY